MTKNVLNLVKKKAYARFGKMKSNRSFEEYKVSIKELKWEIRRDTGEYHWQI